MSQNITDGTFDGFIRNHCAVLSFTSPWCAACKKVHAHTEGLEQSYGAVAFGIIDISTSPETPARLQVFSIPTVIFFRDGEEVNRLSGAITDTDLRTGLDALV